MAFRGPVITLPIGLQGFSGSRNPSKLGPGHFGYVDGVDIDGEVITKENGATIFNASPLAGNVIAGINWSPVAGEINDIIVTTEGKVRKDTGAGTFATDMGDFDTPVIYPPYILRAGGEDVGATRKLFLYSDSNQVQMVDGDADVIAEITDPPADWASSFPIFGVAHRGRVFAGGNASDPHRIYYSQITNHQNFVDTGSGNLSVYPAEGEQLVGGISYKGILILFKYPRGIYLVNTIDADITNWRVDKLTDAVGAVSPWTIVQIGNDVLYLMNDGTFHLLSATQDFGDINTSNISHDPNYIDVFMRSNVALASMKKAVGTWYAAKSKAWFMVPSIGTTDNNLRIVIDFNNPQIGPRYYLSRRDEGLALWIKPNTSNVGQPVLSDSSGQIWLMDVESVLNKDGDAYTMRFESSENDFSFADPNLAAHTKNGHYVELTADVQGESQITLVPYWDGNATDPIIMDLAGAGAALDEFTLDVDELGAAGTVTVRRPLTGQGRRLKILGQNNIADSEVRIGEFRVGYSVADERTSVLT